MILAALLAVALADEPAAAPTHDPIPKRRVQPEFPEAAKALDIAEANCTVRFFIDEKGKPYDVQIREGCPNVFHEAIYEAAWKWAFYPLRDDAGQPVKATYTLKLTFRLNGSSGPFFTTLGGAWTPSLRPGAAPALGHGFNAELRGEGDGLALGVAPVRGSLLRSWLLPERGRRPAPGPGRAALGLGGLSRVRSASDAGPAPRR